MAWHFQALSHYLDQYTLTSMMTYGVNKGQWFNSLRLSDSYLHQLTKPPLVQIMACQLPGTKSLSEPMMPYCLSDVENKIQWKLNKNAIVFSQEETYENVICETAVIFSWPQNVKGLIFYMYWQRYNWCNIQWEMGDFSKIIKNAINHHNLTDCTNLSEKNTILTPAIFSYQATTGLHYKHWYKT